MEILSLYFPGKSEYIYALFSLPVSPAGFLFYHL